MAIAFTLGFDRVVVLDLFLTVDPAVEASVLLEEGRDDAVVVNVVLRRKSKAGRNGGGACQECHGFFGRDCRGFGRCYAES